MTEVESATQMPIDGLESFEPNLSKADEERRLIKSYIAVLTSALGGLDYSSDKANPPYRLGDEAFACLKDIKKWLKSYDDERKSFEVAIACAETGLVVNDLLVILCEWEAGILNKGAPAFRQKMNDKIALACLELLVPLTWPLKLKEGLYKHQIQHFVNLKKHQVNYKKHILSYQGGRTLKAIVRLALPIIALPRVERTGRDNGILRLCTYFFRNVLSIQPAAVTKETSKHLKPGEIVDNMPSGVNHEDISLGACLTSFDKNMVFQYLLTVCGSITKDFDGEFLALTCLEMIYELTRGIKASVVIEERKKQQPLAATPAPSASTISSNQSTTNLGLSDLLSKENEMKMRFIKANGSSRHGRFGTLISLQTPDQGRLTLSGQKNLSDNQNTIAAFDAHKNWHKAQPFRYDSDENVIFSEVSLSQGPKAVLNKFINNFLDGAFNPLINAISRELTSDSDTKPIESKIHFLLVIAWFLEAERYRNGAKVDNIDYGLIVAGLKERTFILVFKYLMEGLDNKQWSLAHSSIIGFKEIVTTVNYMGQSPNEEDQEIAVNIKERLFHKEHYLQTLARIPKEAYKHSPSYVNNCVDFVHIVLKTLEEFSNEDMVLVVKSKRRRNKRSKNLSKEQQAIDDLSDSDDESLERTGKKLSKERKFNFQKYQENFVNIGTIDTYITYLSRFHDLSEKDIKKGLQFLHRVFVAQKKHTILYRMDFLLLLHTLLANDGLSRKSSIRKHFSQFLSYFMSKLRKSLETTPSLYIEMLFPKMNQKDLKYFLETGEMLVDTQKVKKANKYAIIKGEENMELETKVSIMVAALIDDDKRGLVEWVGDELEKILVARIQHEKCDIPPNSNEDESERPQQSEAQESAPHQDYKIQTDNSSFMNALVTNPKLRYILDLANCDLPDQTGEYCIFRANADQFRLSETVTYIKMYLMQPVDFENDKVAANFIKIKQARDAFDADSDDDFNGDGKNRYNSDSDDEVAFEVTGFKNNEGYADDILDNLEDAIERTDKSIPKGVARSKNKVKRENTSSEGGTRRRRRRKSAGSDDDEDDEDARLRKRAKKRRRNRGLDLPMHDISGDEGGSTQKKAQMRQHDYISSKYVNDSADESDDEDFFANEQRLREILNKNNGVLGAQQLQEFVTKNLKSKVTTEDFSKGNKYFSEDEDGDQDQDEPRRTTELMAAKLPQKNQLEDLDDEESDTESLSQETTRTAISRNRAIIDDDDDDGDDSDLNGEVNEFAFSDDEINNETDVSDKMKVDNTTLQNGALLDESVKNLEAKSSEETVDETEKDYKKPKDEEVVKKRPRVIFSDDDE